MKLFRLLVVISLFPLICQSQDIHFSQFYSSPLTLNPAATGDYTGDYRVMNTYRSQWAKIDPGYITNAFGFDKQFFIANQKLSGGFLLVYDRSGVNILKATKISLSIAYHRNLGKNAFHAGIQGGYVIKSIDKGRISFPDQFNNASGQFDPDISTNQSLLDDKNSFADFSVGLSWNRTFGKHTPKIGFSFFHLNKPKDSFLNSGNKIPLRKVITVANRWELNDKLRITPRVMFMEQIKSNDFVFGATLTRKTANPENKFTDINFGLYMRNSFNSQSDAVIPVVGFTYSHFDFGLSYDINISKLEVATNKRGGFELSIIYTALSTRLLKIKIPCERY